MALDTRLDVAQIAPGPTSAETSSMRGPLPEGTRVMVGLVDRPREQEQTGFGLDVADPSTVTFTGGPRSGRTTALRMAAVCAARQLPADQLHIYAIDCAGGGLRPLEGLPHCGGFVTQDAPGSIIALLGRLSRELDRRRQGRTGALGCDGGLPEPSLLLLLDGWEGFLAAVEDLDAGRGVDTLLRLLRDGTTSGLSVLITGDFATLAARLSSAVQCRLVLRLSDPADFALAGLSRQDIPATMPPGRAVDTADGSEIQFAIFGDDPSSEAQLAATARVVAEAAERERCEPSSRRPFVVRALPPRVHLDELTGHRPPGHVVLGLGGDSGEPVAVQIGGADSNRPGLRFLIAGPARSGRSTLLRTVLVQLARLPHLVVVAAGGSRSPVVALAREREVSTLDPHLAPAMAVDEVEHLLTESRRVALLIDDTELFNDTAVGERLAAMIRRSPLTLDVFATGRVDDLAMAFGGIAAEIKRARTGVLLQPGPGDGELFGLRLPFHRSLGPPGRGLLVAPDVAADPTGAGALPLQVALA